jgi:hypothetical protein
MLSSAVCVNMEVLIAVSWIFREAQTIHYFRASPLWLEG